MNKTLEIDLSGDRLIGIAADLVDEHNYIGALKMLNRYAEMYLNDEDSYMLYAEIFDDIGLHEKCINSWFRYIDCTLSEDLADAYEGLAVAYMNLGNEHFSAFYYNQLLMNTDDIDAEMRGEIMDSFLYRDKNPLKFVYPPKIADCSDIISEGIDCMRTGEFDKAVEIFSGIDEENSDYLTARNYIAMCHIICDKSAEAEKECENILEKYPENVQALTTLAAVKTEQQKVEEGRALAERLLSLNVKNPDDIYKIATVCCENKMHAEAYGLFCKLQSELEYDKSVLYFKAVSAYNCKKFEESFATFDKLLTIYPNSVIARYNYQSARKAMDGGTPDELSYFYRMPMEERESTFKILAAFSKLNDREAEALYKNVDITDCILWCFDETEHAENSELQVLAAACAVKAELDGMVCDILLNAFLPDGLKVQTLTLIGERNEDNIFGVVICHIYKKVSFRALKLGRLKRKIFVSAYARLTAHFAIIDSSYGEKFAKASEKLYTELEAEGRLSKVGNVSALSAVIYDRAGIAEPQISRDKLASFFDTTEKEIKKILGEI